MPSPLRFTIHTRCTDSRARVGLVETPHGVFETPAFMPVGTRGSIKGLTPDQVAATGAQIVLNNAYHLMLRPGDDLIARLGGVHAFMRWDGPILTDSGGYQAYSMSDINALDEDGVTFKSIIDGSTIHLGPERAMQVQNNLGADIIMAFDDCPPADPLSTVRDRQSAIGNRQSVAGGKWRATSDHASRLRDANERTIRWLERCVQAHARKRDQALFGIVQGGTDLDMRRESAEQVTNIDLPGYAIGGVAVGEGTELIRHVTEFTAPLLPPDKPRYLMGVGYERDIVAAVRAGVDMFDCVLPTRNGRNANAFTRTGTVRLRNAQYAEDMRPIEEGCDCYACAPSRRPLSAARCPLGSESGRPHPESGAPRAESGKRKAESEPHGPARCGFSRAYLRHLFASGEMLGPILVSHHNLRHFQRLMLDIRRAIREDGWSWLSRNWPVLEAGTGTEVGGRTSEID